MIESLVRRVAPHGSVGTGSGSEGSSPNHILSVPGERLAVVSRIA